MLRLAECWSCEEAIEQFTISVFTVVMLWGIDERLEFFISPYTEQGNKFRDSRPSVLHMTPAYTSAKVCSLWLCDRGLFMPALGCSSQTEVQQSDSECVWQQKPLTVLTDRGEETQPCV